MLKAVIAIGIGMFWAVQPSHLGGFHLGEDVFHSPLSVPLYTIRNEDGPLYPLAIKKILVAPFHDQLNDGLVLLVHRAGTRPGMIEFRKFDMSGIRDRCCPIGSYRLFNIRHNACELAPIRFRCAKNNLLGLGGLTERLHVSKRKLGGRLTSVLECNLKLAFCSLVDLADDDRNPLRVKVSPQLPLSGISSYPVGLESRPDSDEYADKASKADQSAEPCPPRAIGRRVCGFPLGAQVGIVSVLFGAAWLCLLVGALRPFRLLVIKPRDVRKSIAYAIVSLCVFGMAFWVGMIGSG